MSTNAEKPKSTNARTAPRYQAVKFIWYKVVEDDIDNISETSAGISRTCDISASGVGLYTTELLPVGKLIFIELVTGDFNLSAIGKIVHVKPSKNDLYRAGVLFLVIPPNDRYLFGKLLKHYRDTGRKQSEHE